MSFLLFVSCGCRRDSFITHRAFCDALAHDSTSAITALNPLLSSHTQILSHMHSSNGLQAPPVKREQDFNLRPEIPSWLACSTSVPPPPLLQTHLDQSFVIHHENPNPSTTLLPHHLNNSTSSNYPHMSATDFLQKASQIGVTVSKTTTPSPSPFMLRPHMMMQQQVHVPEMVMASSSAVSGIVMPSRDEIGTGGYFTHGLASYGNKAAITSGYFEADQASCLYHDMMGGTVPQTYERDMFMRVSHQQVLGSKPAESTQEMFMRGMFNPTRDADDGNFEYELVSKSTQPQFSKSDKVSSGGAGDDEMTRDFLSLRAFSHMSGLDPLGSLSYGKQNHDHAQWQG